MLFIAQRPNKLSEKIENCAIPEIKQSIISLLDQFSNKSIWLQLYKRRGIG